MKRFFSLFIVMLCLILVFCSCESEKNSRKDQPVTEQPTEAPVTDEPTEAPTDTPTGEPTEAPTEEPTEVPTDAPTEEPTERETYPPMTLPEGYEGFDGPVEQPAFTDGASIWSATRMGGVVRIDDRYRIVSPNGNASVTTNAIALRNSINTALSLSIVNTTDRETPQEREICIGQVSGRAELTAVMEQYGEYLIADNSAVGSFFIGVKDGMIIIFGLDNQAIAAGIKFFTENYITNAQPLQGDLVSAYIYDKIEYAQNKRFAFMTIAELQSQAEILSVTVNGAKYDAYSAEVFNYEGEILLDEEMPVLAAMAGSPYAGVSIQQPTDANNGQGIITVTSGDGTTNRSYYFTYTRAQYSLIDMTVQKLKDGATGVLCLVGDDGFKDTTEFMVSVCREYGLKCNIGLITNKLGTLEKDGNGKYIIDESGRFSISWNPDGKGLSGGGTPAWYRDFVAANSDVLQISSHSYTHGSWGLDENTILAELVGSQQMIREFFPGQRALTFVYPGYSSSNRDAEYAKAREYMPGVYLAARFLSTGKYNSLTNPTYYVLDTCSFYYSPKDTWGDTSINNNMTWFINAINKSVTSGGWVVTMNHMIQASDDGLNNGNMTISQAYFRYVIENYVAEHVESGALWSAFFDEASQYVYERNHVDARCCKFADGHIEFSLQLTEDALINRDLCDYPLTVDIPVDLSWERITYTYSDRDGVSHTETLTPLVATDGSHYVRIEFVPDCGTASLTRAD